MVFFFPSSSIFNNRNAELKTYRFWAAYCGKTKPETLGMHHIYIEVYLHIMYSMLGGELNGEKGPINSI